ncbi:MAG: RNA polymerase sigma factor [Chitinophagales bacterium]
MRLTDRLVAKRIQEGDVEAFEKLINLFKSRVFSYCLRMSNDYYAAEELTQDIFLKVYRGINGYDSRKSSLSTWIFRICRNTCLNYVRDAKRRPSPINDEEYPDQLVAADHYFMLEQRVLLMEALNALILEDRDLVLMKDYLDLPYRDIGQIMGIPVGTVKSRLNRIRAKLQSILTNGESHA